MRSITRRIQATIIFWLFIIIGISCAPAVQTPVPIPISTTAIPTYTFTPSQTPTKTPTPTNTFTPSPTPVGGALISFKEYDWQSKESFCGLMSAEKRLIRKNRFYPFEAYQEVRYCPRQAVTRYGNDPISSPDNQKYLYEVGRDASKDLLYYVGDVSSGKSRFLVDLISYVSFEFEYPSPPSLVWLADNRHLVFFDRNSERLILLNSNDGTLKVLGSFPSAEHPRVTRQIEPSPSDPLILFSSGELSSDMYLFNTETLDDRNLTTDVDSVWICCFQWSPDGSRFSFFINEKKTQSSQIVPEQRIMDRNGNLIAILENAGKIAWSPDGDQFFFECSRLQDTSELCLSDANGGEIVKVEHARIRGATNYTWSPDGEKVAYYTSILKNNGTRHLTAHVLWLKTGEEKDIVSFPEFMVVFPIQWSPDSQWLLFNGAGPNVLKELGLLEGGNGTVLLCDLQAICNNLNGTRTVILSAEWWKPPPNWQP